MFQISIALHNSFTSHYFLFAFCVIKLFFFVSGFLHAPWLIGCLNRLAILYISTSFLSIKDFALQTLFLHIISLL